MLILPNFIKIKLDIVGRGGKQDMPKNTFEKIGQEINHFIDKILLKKPDFIVPVKKKGCKLIRYYQNNFSSAINEKIRYIDFFQNVDLDLRGKKIIVIDDATKYTSTLSKYRDFFEAKGATVETYSFVGQTLLKTGEREKYDKEAIIYKFLPESTYQEYIIQQSQAFSADDLFFDIDHLAIKISLSKDKYDYFLKRINRIGDLIFVNDFYTPMHIEKVSIININYHYAEILFNTSVSQGILQKVRLAYNRKENYLTIVGLSYPVWNSNITDINTLFKNVPFEIPYRISNGISMEGIYFNIVYIFHVFLIKHFLTIYSDIFLDNTIKILDNDLIGYVGKKRADIISQSLINFFKSNKKYESKILEKEKIIIPKKNTSTFDTVKQLMDNLRNHYNKMVDEAQTVLGINYFLSYEEIFENYQGSANLYKWIDILCDRGVLVTRNCNTKGIYYRGGRSGEGDSSHIEDRTKLLIPIAINSCGEQEILNGKVVYSIGSTYLNKVLANMVVDYPSLYENNDFHCLMTKPYYYGPFTYIQDSLNGEADIPLSKVNKFSEYCSFIGGSNESKYYSRNIDDDDILEKINNLFGDNDSTPYSQIAAYFDVMKLIHDNTSAKFLNELVLCRNESLYYQHVYYNFNNAFRLLSSVNQFAKYDKFKKSIDVTLLEATKHLKSGMEKLKYDQKNVYDKLSSINVTRINDKRIITKIKASFQKFRPNFYEEIKPIIIEISIYENIVLNIFKFQNSYDVKYIKRLLKSNLNYVDKQKLDFVIKVVDGNQEPTKEMIKKSDTILNKIVNNSLNYIENLFTTKLEKPGDSQYLNNRKRENRHLSICGIKRYIEKNHLDIFTVVCYSFKNFKNCDITKDIDVLQEVKRIVRKSPKGISLFEPSGGEEYGVMIFNKIQDAIDFKKYLSNSCHEFGYIPLRFYCSCKNIDLRKEELSLKIINNSLDEVKNLMKSIKIADGFYIDEESFKIINLQELKEFNFKINKTLSKTYYELEEDNMDRVIIRQENVDYTKKIGIITVLSEEYYSMKSMLANPHDEIFPGHGIGNRFTVGDIKTSFNTVYSVVLCQTLGDGNNKAALRAAKMLEHYPNLTVIFMVGIAGGTPIDPNVFTEYDENKIIENHVRLGDIVVGKGIIQYDYKKENANGFFKPKGDNIPPCALVEESKQILDNLQFEENDISKLPWNKYIDTFIKNNISFSRPKESTDIFRDYDGNQISHPIDKIRNNKYPKVFCGKIASSNAVLKNPEKRDLLKKQFNVFAIEMETSGIADATWESTIGYYAVRGICDYCDRSKNDLWHNYAAITAAAYTRALLENIVIKENLKNK